MENVPPQHFPRLMAETGIGDAARSERDQLHFRDVLDAAITLVGLVILEMAVLRF